MKRWMITCLAGCMLSFTTPTLAQTQTQPPTCEVSKRQKARAARARAKRRKQRAQRNEQRAAEPSFEAGDPLAPAQDEIEVDASATGDERASTSERSSSQDDVEDPAGLDADSPSVIALELDARLRLLARFVEYENASPGPRGQEYPLGVVPVLAVRWYPAAHVTASWVAQIGVALHARWMVPTTLTWGSSELDVENLVLGAALRVRVPVARHELGVQLGYEVDDLDVSRSQFDEGPKSPGFESRFVRAGLDARIALSERFSLEASASYLFMSVEGELRTSAWFPHARADAGYEGSLGVRYAVSDAWLLHAGIGMQHSSIDLHPSANDLGVLVFGRAASALTNRSLYGELGVGLRL